MVTGSLLQSPRSVLRYHALVRLSAGRVVGTLLDHAAKTLSKSPLLAPQKTEPSTPAHAPHRKFLFHPFGPHWPDRRATATRASLGTASLSSSSRLPLSSLERSVRPVTFPPGRARLSTRPASTGSNTEFTMTIGIVLVASLAARIHRSLLLLR